MKREVTSMKENHEEEINNSKVQTSLFDLSVQVLAIIVFLALLVFDKGLGLMKTPLNDIWYGIIGGFGVGGIDLLKAILRRR